MFALCTILLKFCDYISMWQKKKKNNNDDNEITELKK